MKGIKVDVDAQTTKQLAIEHAMGATKVQLSKTFNLSIPVVERLLKSDLCRVIVQDTQEKSQRAAVAHLKQRMSGLVDKAVKVIEDALDQGDLNAVKLVYTALAIDQKPGVQQERQLQSIQVILPGAVIPKMIEVESEVVNGD